MAQRHQALALSGGLFFFGRLRVLDENLRRPNAQFVEQTHGYGQCQL